MSNISVITSLVGGKDHLSRGHVKGKAKWIAYVDELTYSDDWTIEKAYDKFKSARRNSRIPKLLIHKFVDTEYSIWLDANIKLLISPEEVIHRYLKDHDIATFTHPIRDCIYDEAMECAKRGLDDPEVIIEQARAYEIDGYAKHRGLGECMMIVRRHTPKVEAFNNTWWAEYCRYSVRDQISFMYSLDKVGLTCNFIDVHFREEKGKIVRGDIIELVPHLTVQTIGN